MEKVTFEGTAKQPARLNSLSDEPIYSNGKYHFLLGANRLIYEAATEAACPAVCYGTRSKDFIISKIKTLILLQLLVVAAVIVVFSGYHLLTKARPGTVTGILYTVESPSALIDGQIVKEGDIIRGVTVVKIHEAEVEFKKNHKLWKQRVGQPPNPAWTEDD